MTMVGIRAPCMGDVAIIAEQPELCAEYSEAARFNLNPVYDMTRTREGAV